MDTEMRIASFYEIQDLWLLIDVQSPSQALLSGFFSDHGGEKRDISRQVVLRGALLQRQCWQDTSYLHRRTLRFLVSPDDAASAGDTSDSEMQDLLILCTETLLSKRREPLIISLQAVSSALGLQHAIKR